MGYLVDSFGRRIRALRISLTDHCNFRCVYCMPPEGLPTMPRDDYLSVEQIARFARVAASLGVERFRLTGGEPLLRQDVVDIVRTIKQIDLVGEVSMTTNASLLDRFAQPLRDAGLDRINVSLDSLDAERFNTIVRTKQFDRVSRNIDLAVCLGFPVKINVVVLKGMPTSEILDYVHLAVDNDIEVRFLEFMPLCGSGWDAESVLPIADVRRAVRDRFDLIETPRGDRPSETFEVAGGKGRVGFIAPLSEPFCGACSRMRLTADGKIRPCLFSEEEYSIREHLEPGVPDSTLIAAIRQAVWRKVWGSEFAADPFRSGEAKPRVLESPFIRSIGG